MPSRVRSDTSRTLEVRDAGGHVHQWTRLFEGDELRGRDLVPLTGDLELCYAGHSGLVRYLDRVFRNEGERVPGLVRRPEQSSEGRSSCET